MEEEEEEEEGGGGSKADYINVSVFSQEYNGAWFACFLLSADSYLTLCKLFYSLSKKSV